ncbi:hypothetical protein, partial [Streptomyces sp. 8N706]|uniref:hypothetical protein n=1 Tax=Streptomyces sp. 8N706 TaxID=3457416 RepID=UPI003FD412C7
MAEERQGEAVQDAVMTRIGQAIMLHRAGDREEARNRFAELWEEIGDCGDPYHRCTLAHYMADTQDDPADELAWDVRALDAADSVGGPPAAAGDAPPVVRAFYPSLHLSLAADYVKLRRPDAARRELHRARDSAGVLGDDEYGDGVRAAIARLELRLNG